MKKISYLLSAMVICGAALFGCSDKEVKTVEEPQQTQEEQTKEGIVAPKTETPKVEEKQEEPVTEEKVTPQVYRFGLGETVGMTSNYGDYEFTVTEAYWTDDRNQFSDTRADKVLVIVYEYKNVSYVPDYTDGLFICEGVHYQVYGEDGFALETYPADKPYYQDEVTEGRSSRGSEAFAVVGDQHHFEIELGQDVIVEFDVE